MMGLSLAARHQWTRTFSTLAILWAGAMFGFFFAWVTAAMPGLDVIDPNTAMYAMQSMNHLVRNPAFGSVFFGAPILIGLAAVASLSAGAHETAWLQVLALVAFITGVTVLTLTVHVPLNQALSTQALPMPEHAAQTVWTGYSEPWQFYNLIRMGVSGAVLCVLVTALWKMPRCHNA